MYKSTIVSFFSCDNLEFIKNAMDDPVFIDLMKYVAYTQNIYNYKIIGAFKKDFWKEFDYKGLKQTQQKPNSKAKKSKSTGGAKKKKYCLSLSSFTRRLKPKLNNNRKPKKTRRK
jgi:hypothetical protein